MHEGHRQRMYSKLESGENLYDHEILEILLYVACPRVNTNPIAHNLLERFCSISEIFKADLDELKTVEGVGDKIANFIKTVGLCAERAGKTEGFVNLETFGDFKKFVSMRLKGKTEEFIEIYFLEKSGRVIRTLSYTSADRNKASVNAVELNKNIALVKPAALLAAHNHVNGSVTPSENDGVFTSRLQMICSMNDVNLLDHVIYSDGEFFSYKDSGWLDKIKRGCSLDNVEEWTKISN